MNEETKPLISIEGLDPYTGELVKIHVSVPDDFKHVYGWTERHQRYDEKLREWLERDSTQSIIK